MDIDKNVKDQFFTLLKKRNYDTVKFKFINVNNNDSNTVYKLCYDNKFITYIGTNNKSKSSRNKQVKSWYSYRRNLLNYIRTIINDKSVFDTVCIINIVDDGIFLEKCLESINKQSRTVFVILLVSSIDEMKIAIENNIEYLFTTDKSFDVKLTKCFNFIRGTLNNTRVVMLCNSNDVFTSNWVKEGSYKITHDGYDIVGKNSNYIINSKDGIAFKRTFNTELAKDKFDTYYWNNIFLTNGIMIRKNYLAKLNWILIDQTVNHSGVGMYYNIIKHGIGNPKLYNIKNSECVSIYSEDIYKHTIDEEVVDEYNILDNVRKLPNFRLKVLEEYISSVRSRIRASSNKNPKKILLGLLNGDEENLDINEGEIKKKPALIPTIIRSNKNPIKTKMNDRTFSLDNEPSAVVPKPVPSYIGRGISKGRDVEKPKVVEEPLSERNIIGQVPSYISKPRKLEIMEEAEYNRVKTPRSKFPSYIRNKDNISKPTQLVQNDQVDVPNTNKNIPIKYVNNEVFKVPSFIGTSSEIKESYDKNVKSVKNKEDTKITSTKLPSYIIKPEEKEIPKDKVSDVPQYIGKPKTVPTIKKVYQKTPQIPSYISKPDDIENDSHEIVQIPYAKLDNIGLSNKPKPKPSPKQNNTIKQNNTTKQVIKPKKKDNTLNSFDDIQLEHTKNKIFKVIQPTKKDDERNKPKVEQVKKPRVVNKFKDNIKVIPQEYVEKEKKVVPPYVMARKNDDINKIVNKIKVVPSYRQTVDMTLFEYDQYMLNNIDLNNDDCKYRRWARSDFTKKSPNKILAVVPVLGRHLVLEECIGCIQYQTEKTDILLLVSNDEDTEFAKKMKLKYVYVENNPLSKKFQRGVDFAKILNIKYMMFVGSDDFLTKNWVKECKRMLDNKPYNVIGKSSHYIYDFVNNSYYIRTYVSDNLRYIPQMLRKNWSLGTGRLIKSSILDRIDWTLFKRDIDKGLDGESGLILYKGGATFGLISKENFLSIRDDWDCITKMAEISSTNTNAITRIKAFNPEISALKDKYIRNKDLEKIKLGDNINVISDNKPVIRVSLFDLENEDDDIIANMNEVIDESG
jgi:hypothetical protein